MKLRRLMCGVLVVAAAFAGCGSESASTGAEADETVSEATAATTTTLVSETTVVESTTAAESTITTAPAESAPTVDAPAPEFGGVEFVSDATVFDERFTSIDAGTHRVNTLGTPISFTLDTNLIVQPNEAGFFVIAHPDNFGPSDRDIVMAPVTALSDPGNMSEPFGWPIGDGWPTDDFGGWLDSVSDSLVVTNRSQTTLGGRDAEFAQLAIADDLECSAQESCALLTSNFGRNSYGMARGSIQRVWLVDMGEGVDPIMVFNGINRPTDADWFAVADQVLATLAFGEPQPNPISVADGPTEFEIFGGVKFTADEPTPVHQLAGFGATLHDVPIGVEFLYNPKQFGGDLLTSTDELIATLTDANIVVDEREPSSIDGFDARVLALESGTSTGEVLTRNADSNAPWASSEAAQMWVIEHPERGLLVISAEAYFDADTFLPQVLEVAGPIVSSLTFIDAG